MPNLNNFFKELAALANKYAAMDFSTIDATDADIGVDAFSSTGAKLAETVKETVVEKVSTKREKDPDEDVDVFKSNVEESAEEDTPDFDNMKLGELRRYWKAHFNSEPPVGGKDVVKAAILKELESAEEEEVEDNVTPMKTSATKKKTGEPVDPDEEEIDDEEETPADENADIQEEVEKILEGVTEGDLKKFMKEQGLSVIGRKQALIAILVDEIAADNLDATDLADYFAEDEDDEELPEPPKAKKDNLVKMAKKEPEPEEDDDEEEAPDYMEYDGMSDERSETIAKLTKQIKAGIKKGTLTERVMQKFVNGFYIDDDEDMPDDITDAYIEGRCRMIDDMGKERDTGEIYDLNGWTACCGYYCDGDEEDSDVSICVVCGSKYE